MGTGDTYLLSVLAVPDFDHFKKVDSPVLSRTLNPQWDMVLEFEYETAFPNNLKEKHLRIEVYDVRSVLIGWDISSEFPPPPPLCTFVCVCSLHACMWVGLNPSTFVQAVCFLPSMSLLSSLGVVFLFVSGSFIVCVFCQVVVLACDVAPFFSLLPARFSYTHTFTHTQTHTHTLTHSHSHTHRRTA